MNANFHTAHAASLPPIRLLLISQSHFVRDALAEVLERNPRVLIAAVSETEAVAGDCMSLFDAVLLLPEDQTDVDIARQIRDGLPNVPVIACGLRESDESNWQTWLAAGADGYINNTVHLSEFLPIVSTIISSASANPRARYNTH